MPSRPLTYMEEAPDSPPRRVWSSSAFGGSLRVLIAYARGLTPTEPSDLIQAAYADGHRLESVLLADVASRGFIVDDGQMRSSAEHLPPLFKYARVDDTGQFVFDLVVSMPDPIPTQIIRTHPDALAYGTEDQPPRTYTVEVKALGKTLYAAISNQGLNAVPKYKWQVSTQMHAVGTPGIFAYGLKVDGDAGAPKSIANIRLLSFLLPPIPLALFRARLIILNRYLSDLTLPLPPCDCGLPFFCGFNYICEGETDTAIGDDGNPIDNSPIPVPPDQADAFFRACNLYRDGITIEKDGKEMKQEATKLLAPFAALGPKLFSVDYKLTQVTSSRSSLDPEKVKAALKTDDLTPYMSSSSFTFPKVTPTTATKAREKEKEKGNGD